MKRRDPDAAPAAVVRREQMYPFPADEMAAAIEAAPSAREVVWVQEEPENMGAWGFVHARLHRVLRERLPLRHASRAESASPAAGSQKVHEIEQEKLLAEAFA